MPGHLAIPPPVLEVCEELARRGFRAWVVGGCVRDLLMDKRVSDWDLATDARPEDVRRTFKRTIPTGLAHGTVTVMHRGVGYEVTTLRVEGEYSDGRRPERVEFVSDIDADLARRDFTVNAIAYDPVGDVVVDPWGGQGDLRDRVIRAVRDPAERFAEDGLRALRAARFVATLEMDLEPATERAIPGALGTLARVSPERVLAELTKAMTSRAPSRCFEVMRRTRMLPLVAPPLEADDDARFAQRMRLVDASDASPIELRWTALLAPSRGAELGPVDAWLRDLRASNALRESTLALLAAPEPPPRGEGERALREWMQAVGRERVGVTLAFRAGLARVEGEMERHAALVVAVEEQLARGVALATRDLAIGGREVMDALGAAPGRIVGRVLDALLARVIEDPAKNDEATLRALVPEIVAALEAGR